jgi:tetratricopeptide (TPR) repeat protein
LFEAKDYERALASFEEAISNGYKSAEAYLGAGWSNLMLENISDAIDACNDALEEGYSKAEDAYCGLSIAYLATLGTATDAQKAASYADSVLSIDSHYTFSHLATVNYLDVHLVRAEANLYLGDYARVQQSLDILDPDNGLDPEDSNTWVVDGRRYNTYLEALIAEIEYVRPLIEFR